jgi:hypothetical protein
MALRGAEAVPTARCGSTTCRLRAEHLQEALDVSPLEAVLPLKDFGRDRAGGLLANSSATP